MYRDVKLQTILMAVMTGIVYFFEEFTWKNLGYFIGLMCIWGVILQWLLIGTDYVLFKTRFGDWLVGLRWFR